ncbi:MAG TPA: hypothetical protein VMU84_11220 [Thermoanaerobaculia bacterium]|nr:hypothetical protein [Thermoanaerobaculia bacterium]
MKRAATGIAIVLFAATAFAADVIDELLKIPLPPIPFEVQPLTPPPDDAPFDALVDFWAWKRQFDLTPTAVVRERLVDVIERQPDALRYVVDLFPPTDSICSRVKQAVATQEEGYREESDAWLVQQCQSERGRLIALALATTEDETGIVFDTELRALAKHWSDAEPVLRRLARSPQNGVRASAIALLYEHAPGDDLRRELQSIAIDAGLAYSAREHAIETLARAKWDGRDEWLISLMREPAAAFALPQFLGARPEWIPIMRAFLQSSDRATHSAAANALARFSRADAVAPLVPWIGDPEWADDASNARGRVMENAGELGLTDAIPGLVARLPNADIIDRYVIINALGNFHDLRVHAALRKELEGVFSPSVVAALLSSGGWTLQERAQSLSAGIKFPSAQFFLGQLMRLPANADDEVARIVLAHVHELQSIQPALANELLAKILPWDVPSVNAFLFEHIEDGTANAQTIAAALQRRDSLREHYHANVRRLVAKDGTVRGIGVVLAAQQRLLSALDADALRAMLASARITRDRFPVDLVVRAFGVNAALDRAAEAYLVAEDSREARAIVRQRHEGELLILGEGSRRCTDWEAALLDRFHRSDAEEVFALWLCDQTNPSPVEIFVKSDGALVNGTMRSARELAELRDFLATTIDELGAIGEINSGVPEYEYVHLTRSSGRRVVMSMAASDSTFGEMMRRMTELVPQELTEPAVR